MSDSERQQLEVILKQTKGTVTRWIRGAENALVLSAVLTLLFVLAWWVVAWVVRKTFHAEIGWHNASAIWIAAIGTVTCASYAIISSIRWIHSWPDIRPDIRADVAGGQVVEERYSFTQAKRFQEPEHGGLFYYLHTTTDEVLVVFDEESQDLGARGEVPLKSSFRPTTDLVIVRAPKTKIVLSRQFSGAALDAGVPLELKTPPKAWPESETLSKIPWNDLDTRLGKKKRGAQPPPGVTLDDRDEK
jgi:hypothetical protein